MRRSLRALAAAVLVSGLTLFTTSGPASAEGKCFYVYVGDTGTTVCTPDI